MRKGREFYAISRLGCTIAGQTNEWIAWVLGIIYGLVWIFGVLGFMMG